MKAFRILYLVLLAPALLLVSCGPKEDPATKAAAEKAAMMEQNKATSQKILDAFAAGSTDIGNYVSENLVDHQIVPGGATSGIKAMTDALTFYHAAFPDMKLNVLAMIADGDYVVAHQHITATNSGPMGTTPATNKSMDVTGVDMFRFEGGKVVEHWGYYEEMKMMEQLFPQPEEVKKK